MPTTSLPRQLLKSASRIADLAVTPTPGITVLIYHRVGAARAQRKLQAAVEEFTRESQARGGL